ncbi:uncharacterized protein I303_103990 [Kwoniella dejecticola CBS 10117]|uniref:Uncharacterized protein n=1 Tax=Kwoniella dejecticola CBS 10117 TaxID=1296121 RepID=A0A1A6A8A1_9TREE|nr:uncharacterized protein I303_04007 [Kwoniella dejecticola CBS 10117]OBR86285.1 hypothetical protein I303_04007 [Kwoniella dejecticola CBS 10117]
MSSHRENRNLWQLSHQPTDDNTAHLVAGSGGAHQGQPASGDSYSSDTRSYYENNENRYTGTAASGSYANQDESQEEEDPLAGMPSDPSAHPNWNSYQHREEFHRAPYSVYAGHAASGEPYSSDGRTYSHPTNRAHLYFDPNGMEGRNRQSEAQAAASGQPYGGYQEDTRSYWDPLRRASPIQTEYGGDVGGNTTGLPYGTAEHAAAVSQEATARANARRAERKRRMREGCSSRR